MVTQYEHITRDTVNQATGTEQSYILFRLNKGIDMKLG